MGLLPISSLVGLLVFGTSFSYAASKSPISCDQVLPEQEWVSIFSGTEFYHSKVGNLDLAIELLQLEKRHSREPKEILDLYQEIQRYFKGQQQTPSMALTTTLMRIALKEHLSGIKVMTELFQPNKTHAQQQGWPVSDEYIASAILASTRGPERRVRTIREFSTAKYKVVIAEYEDRQKHKFIKMETFSRDPHSTGRLIATRELTRDSKMGALDVNASQTGAELLSYAIEAGAESAALLWIDLNNLGKVNTFPGIYAAGDHYLAAVGAVITENIREEDFFFRNGGDEIVVIVHSNKRDDIRRIISRISNEVAHRPSLKKMFQDELDKRQVHLQNLRQGNSFADLGRMRLRQIITSEHLFAQTEADLPNALSSLMEEHQKLVTQVESIKNLVPNGPEAAYEQTVLLIEAEENRASLESFIHTQSFAELGKKYLREMKIAESLILLAETDFPKAQRMYVEERRRLVYERESLQPSLSIGSTLIGKGETYRQVLARAQSQVPDIKKQYLEALGLDASKYGGSSGEHGIRDLKAQPPVLDPIPAPATM